VSTIASANGDVVADLTADEARVLTDEIKTGIETTWELVKRAYIRRAWIALGYGSWDSYCSAEFGSGRLRLPREERQEAVASLREAGLSVRAIASATGTSKSAVSRDLAGVPNGTGEGTPSGEGRKFPDLWAGFPPGAQEEAEEMIRDAEKGSTSKVMSPESVTGTDGKSYINTPAAKPRRHPLTDSYSTAVWKLIKAVESVERLHGDDRFEVHRAAFASRHQGDLERASNTLLDILMDLGEAKP